ncbi:MAG: uracil-DNA glycosylase [Bacteroidaceae bacterium]|nr:uracil-DNA glycosylase [Bacteroidaceae bacterium]
MNVQMEKSWHQKLAPEFEKPYFESLTTFIRQEYASGECYPPGRLIFHAFEATPFEKVKVVILGQDPYHEPGQAHGLCFSVPEGVALPPSLRNIYSEIQSELGIVPPQSGDLNRWAKQGVLLLNTTLTVRRGEAASHQGRGWETLTDVAIQCLARDREHIVFMLWGSYAGRKSTFIDPTRHLVLTSAHPSPLSAYRGFFGNHHFQLCNDYLKAHGKEPISW